MATGDGYDRDGDDRDWDDRDGDAIAGPDGLATIYADIALVVDRGETVHCLLCTDREDPFTGETVRRAAGWVVLPRSGFLTMLFAAIDRFVPGGGERDCGRKPTVN